MTAAGLATSIPCPHCGDTWTYTARPTPPKQCARCEHWHGVGMLDGTWVIIPCRPPHAYGRERRKGKRPIKTSAGVHGKKRRNTEVLQDGRSVKRHTGR